VKTLFHSYLILNYWRSDECIDFKMMSGFSYLLSSFGAIKMFCFSTLKEGGVVNRKLNLLTKASKVKKL